MLWRLTLRRFIYWISERRKQAALLGITLGLALGIVYTTIYVGYLHGSGPSIQEHMVVIPRGASVQQIADQLAASQIITRPELFAWLTKLSGGHRDLKAGEYRFPAYVTPAKVLKLLKSGDVYYRQVTIPEGLTVHQAKAIITSAEGLSGEMPRDIPEGSLFPDTYYYSYGDPRSFLVERMQLRMQEVLEEVWQQRAPNTGFISNKRLALVLASLIEKEAGKPEERPIVSAVFHNRLRKGMRLQTDPTVIYGITEGRYDLDRLLTRADLQDPNPYNTYRITGLPPTPIANPGKTSLLAAVQPADSDMLYFVSDAQGGHWFAKTLDEHNNNVRKYRVKLKELRDASQN